MRIVVTGGAGFIGGNLSVYLKGRGYDVVAVDSLERASTKSLLEEAGVELIVSDLRYSIDIPRADIIVHTAAYIDVDESFRKPYEYIVNNTAVTMALAKKSLDDSVKLIYLSSAAVYGEPKYLPIDEDHPKDPISPYGLSKLMGEYAVSFYGRLGLRYAIVRPFNVYGPGQRGSYVGVIARFIDRVRRGEPPVIYGDGSQTRDFIHVSDLSRLIERIIEVDAIGVYNAGSGIETRIIDLAKLVSRLANLDLEPIHVDAKLGDIKRSYADVSKARSLTWSARKTLEEGIKELFDQP
ncbi:MAG: NAD-dependent epimerase/dehydratase family protein [Nitrososphaerota archaeon]|nr:NAD-dependent epimerase/dehydratase family protein [Candidatus Bathyarchaeota archaeon]MCX8162284.1 NAD-dependent epimerase/dehydratase family protein [Candidatus Bathyarchaeota archaeon]MDW8062402.1 NAD-dependent epimerase/dehydratase family protein [Nitrososphaerota archaeon]